MHAQTRCTQPPPQPSLPSTTSKQSGTNVPVASLDNVEDCPVDSIQTMEEWLGQVAFKLGLVHRPCGSQRRPRGNEHRSYLFHWLEVGAERTHVVHATLNTNHFVPLHGAFKAQTQCSQQGPRLCTELCL